MSSTNQAQSVTSKLTVFNSLTRTKETFTPINPNKINMYVCGMTVYDYCHIGHARSLIAFDMINRYLRYLGYDVTFVRNITDIDDKIINRANERNISIQALTEEFITAMHEDCQALNVLNPDFEPKATEYIGEMINIIQALINKGLAYHVPNGDVYYRVRKFKDYGKLSNQNIDDLRIGARIDVEAKKEDPLDFVLWKLAKEGEPYWESPWGKGRCGWHIECSAMSQSLLGKHFDIHGGGMDLKFPHHECEIAQSEGAHDEIMANYWMHNGFINVDNEKMSKSLNNFFTIREVLKVYPAEVLRYFILNAHYRSHINYSTDNLNNAWNNLRRLYTALKSANSEIITQADNLDLNKNHEFITRFETLMNDDFNTAAALGILSECANEFNKTKAPLYYKLLKKFGNILGLLEQDPDAFLKLAIGKENTLSDEEIEALITARKIARENKDFKESDRIRDELKAQNIILEDAQGVTTWRRN